jgi:hypothetical protein
MPRTIIDAIIARITHHSSPRLEPPVQQRGIEFARRATAVSDLERAAADRYLVASAAMTPPGWQPTGHQRLGFEEVDDRMFAARFLPEAAVGGDVPDEFSGVGPSAMD